MQARVMASRDRRIEQLQKQINDMERLHGDEIDKIDRIRHRFDMEHKEVQDLRDANTRLRSNLARSTTRNIDLRRELERLRAFLGDSDVDIASQHDDDDSVTQDSLQRAIHEAIMMHVVEDHVDD
jgi:predicted RNase H-like nuclease (RuvC/YqgF family)